SLDVVEIASKQSYHSEQEFLQAATALNISPEQVWLYDAYKIPSSAGFWEWNLFGGHGAPITQAISVASHPAQAIASVLLAICCIVLFGIYMTGDCAEINRIAFDLPEAESELVSGYNTEYSGIKFAIFFLAEFTNLFIVATIATIMFLGGGASPIPGFLDAYFFQNLFVQAGGLLKGNSQVLWVLGSLLN